ncbi:unnamed protein product [Urochloa decumbens]|uniref:DUF1618 domain-containing protein n=1 Tax=Urochloa decumbens TaxID=240449 RepID=A0ABC9GUC5_9POAL
METGTSDTATAEQPFSGSPSAPYPRWVMLERDCIKSNDDYDYSSSSTPADANTLATSRTTSGHPIQASLHIAESPASSRMCLNLLLPDGVDARYATVIAAHRDSVLIEVIVIEDPGGYESATIDHFVYNAGAAAAEPPCPPVLSLLPPCYITENYSGHPECQQLSPSATGIIRRGDNELVVAELTIAADSDEDAPELGAAELLLFRYGKWIVVKCPEIRNDDPEFGKLFPQLFADTVVPIGDRQLCWVILSNGLLLCDVFEENPVLEYVKLPVDLCGWPPSRNRNVCVTAGGSALKFVNIYPRCCCGGMGATNCQRSHGACVVYTWTLRMSDMEWVKDGMVDATELWALDTYEWLPRLHLGHPVVSMDEPHVICFVMVEANCASYGNKTQWKLMVDMRSKTIRSASCYPEERWDPSSNLIPSNVSYYLNTMSYSKGESKVDTEMSPVQVSNDDTSNVMLQSSCESSEEATMKASEILAALQEILDRDDMLKAIYKILCHDNGRRFGTLLSLPKNTRKDWLLMEMKASED